MESIAQIPTKLTLSKALDLRFSTFMREAKSPTLLSNERNSDQMGQLCSLSKEVSTRSNSTRVVLSSVGGYVNLIAVNMLALLNPLSYKLKSTRCHVNTVVLS